MRKLIVASAFAVSLLVVHKEAKAGAVVCQPGTVTVDGNKYVQDVCWWDDLAGNGSGGGGSGGGSGGGGGGGGGGGPPTTVGLGGFDNNGDLKMDCWKNTTGPGPGANGNNSGTRSTAVSSPYGASSSRPGDWHYGVDYVSTVSTNYGEGQAVHAIANSVVLEAGYNDYNGNYVKLHHSDGMASYYLHLKSVSVAPGDTLTAGRVIGYMNCTGNCYGGGVRNAQKGTHVHVELRSSDTATRQDDHSTTSDPTAYNNTCP